MTNEKKAVIAVSVMVLGLYALIVSIDFGPIPRENTHQKEKNSVVEMALPELAKPSSQSNDHKLPRSDKQLAEEPTDEQHYNRPKEHLLAVKQGERWTVAGDILVDENDLIAGSGDEGFKMFHLDSIDYWPTNEIPVVINVENRRNRVSKAMRTIEKFTSVRFVEYSGEADYITIDRASDHVCQSYLGRKGGEQKILLHRSCSPGQVLHEFMHALGFVHEHSRSDRDQFIDVRWENIFTYRKNQFQKLSSRLSIPHGVPFDFYSIMLYPPHAFSKNNETTIRKLNGELYQVNRSYLSRGDIAKINAIYGPERRSF